MRPTLLLAASALALCACDGKATRVIAKLDCPSVEGDLMRVSAAADGKSCVYRSADGAEVNLELVALTGDPQATLDAIELQLRGDPGPVSEAEAVPATPAPEVPAGTAADAAKAQAEALADSGGERRVEQRVGRHGIVAEEGPDGDTAQVHLPGIRIVAKDGPDGEESAQVQIGSLKVDASGDDTTVKIFREVRMRGEALSREKRGIRAHFIYTGKDLPAGYRYVSYQAGGPKTGPLVVAKIRTKLGEESGDNINHDVEELVRSNGGV